MKPPPGPAPRPTVADRFKSEIERAAAEGAAIEDLTLHLTYGDAEQLKRDRKIPLEAIRFDHGVMRYLGVRIVRGEVGGPSVLKREAAEEGV